MTRRGPALRVAVLGVAAALAGLAVIASVLGWRAHTYLDARHRASDVSIGTVTQDGIGENGDIMVRWADSSGHERVQRFAVYGTDQYRRGSAFAVAYDPAHPAAEGFPHDPDETSALDDLQVPIVLAGVAVALLTLTWVLRGALFRRAAGRPAQPAAAVVLAGLLVDAAPSLLGSSFWLGLCPPGGRSAPYRWQRVMWHPAIDAADDAVTVLVHGDLRSRRRVVIQMPDGTRLVPIGRLRHRPPRAVRLERRSDAPTDLGGAYILPAGILAPPPAQWWRGAFALGVLGIGIGVAMGFLIGGGGIAVAPFAAAAGVFMVNGWALAGSGP